MNAFNQFYVQCTCTLYVYRYMYMYTASIIWQLICGWVYVTCVLVCMYSMFRSVCLQHVWVNAQLTHGRKALHILIAIGAYHICSTAIDLYNNEWMARPAWSSTRFDWLYQDQATNQLKQVPGKNSSHTVWYVTNHTLQFIFNVYICVCTRIYKVCINLHTSSLAVYCLASSFFSMDRKSMGDLTTSK